MFSLKRLLRKFLESRTGVAGVVLALIVTLVALGVIIPIGLLVTANIQTTVNAMDLGTAGNATRTTLFNNIFQAYDLSAITPIIAGAALIISIIIVGFSFRRSGQTGLTS